MRADGGARIEEEWRSRQKYGQTTLPSENPLAIWGWLATRAFRSLESKTTQPDYVKGGILLGNRRARQHAPSYHGLTRPGGGLVEEIPHAAVTGRLREQSPVETMPLGGPT